jgi:hypothetical protein
VYMEVGIRSKMGKIIDLVGQRFSRLTVLKRVKGPNTNKSYWLVQCECGSDPFVVRSDALGRGTKSCGCYRKKLAKESIAINHPRLRHGMAKSPEYRAWSDMKTRCNNPNYEYWDLYGGRGVAVAPEFEVFENWYQEIGPKPGPEYSQDRIDNDRGYEPGNIRWATASEQALNRRPKKNS